MDLGSAPAARRVGAALLILIASAGCDLMPDLGVGGLLGSSSGASSTVADAKAVDQNPDVPPSSDVVFELSQDNSGFDKAQPATMALGGEITIHGAVGATGDVDFYALGPARAGERITVDVTGQDGLNTTVALFDADANLIDANDDRSYYGGRLDPYIFRRLPADTDNLFLGVTVSRAVLFASTVGRFDSGSYSIRVRHETAAQVRSPVTQIAWLDFLGGRLVQIGLEPVEAMNPFSAESISPRLAGQTDYIIDLLLQHMAKDFADFDVVLLDSRHQAKPLERHSELFFGNLSSRFLGLADNVDTGNANLQQEAIIYAETLSLFENLRPSAEEIAQALANVASHELGHLLGLEHTREPGDLMATAATARQVLEQDGRFTRALVHLGVFPVGWQDGPVTLLRNVGPGAGLAARARIADEVPAIDRAFRDALNPADVPVVPMCGRCAR